ncbi:MAG: hypothetical protein AB8F95_21325 [Bacteroidia bacterium]
MNIQTLFETLNQRKRPEDVAQMVLELLGNDLNSKERKLLDKAAKGSLKRSFWGYSSMLEEFARAVGAETQVKKAIELFKLKIEGGIDFNNVDDIEKFIEDVAPLIGKRIGENNFVGDRLNKFERKNQGIEISKRNYNKKWRLLKRLERKLMRFKGESHKSELQKISKHGFAHKIEFIEFAKDTNTACFIAYFNARCNMRSVFTNQSQEQAFDEISNMLFDRCKSVKTSSGFSFLSKEKVLNTSVNTNWWAISWIYPSQEVFSHLTDKQKGMLLGKWTTALQDISTLLSEVWEENDINRESMIVAKGNDSSTWNHAAGAWNKARDNWMNLIYSMGMEYVLDEICFGKVLRLMAGDVAAWHRNSGGGLDPNTEVWNKLPLPWEVFRGEAACTKTMVETQCQLAGINAKKSGWIAPKAHQIAKFKPTPELVHGVAIANPYFAKVLRQHKYFSGKKILS